MSYTEKQVAEQQAKNEELRRQIADLTASREEDEASELLAIRVGQLEAEEAQLQTELAYQQRLKAARKASTEKTETPVVPVATPTETPVVPVTTSVQAPPPAPPTNVEATAATTTGKGK